jgi:hypothetical protein
MKNRIIALVVGMVAPSIICFMLLALSCNQGGSDVPLPPSIIIGIVKDSVAATPIQNALVIMDTVPDTTDTQKYMPFTYTDSSGFYNLLVQGGQTNEPISAFKNGYVSQTKFFSVEPADSVTVNFSLDSTASLSGKW